jgi:hypothetical protein
MLSLLFFLIKYVNILKTDSFIELDETMKSFINEYIYFTLINIFISLYNYNFV